MQELDVASGTSILRAFDRAKKQMDHNDQLPAKEESAGYLVRGKPGQQFGYQVFVKVVRFKEGPQ